MTVSNGIIQLVPQDTSINVDATNYSGSPTLTTYTWPANQAANAIVMKFDVSPIPPGATIQQATLHLSLVESDGFPEATYTVSAQKIVGKNPTIATATGYTADGVTNWTANNCCYNSVPLAQADLAPATDARAINKTLGDKTWTITPIVQDWRANPAANFGLLLDSDASALSDRYRYFASMEHPTVNLRPYLEVAYSVSTLDTTPPVISAVAAGSITTSGATITWTTNETSDSQVDYGLTTAYGTSTPLNASLVTAHTGTVSALTDTTLYHYRARSRDAAGNLAMSGDFTFTTKDGTLPTVSVTAPAAGATVSGTVTMTATAADNVGVVNVQFMRDNVNFGAADTTAPYSISWDTRTATNGAHTLKAVARDAAGNVKTSATLTVTVTNDTTAPVISGVTASALTTSGATIAWTTDEAERLAGRLRPDDGVRHVDDAQREPCHGAFDGAQRAGGGDAVSLPRAIEGCSRKSRDIRRLHVDDTRRDSACSRRHEPDSGCRLRHHHGDGQCI